MAKAPVIEDHQIRHARKVAAITGQSKERDVALLLIAYGTGLAPNEIAKLTVADYLQVNGEIKADSVVRAEIAFNGKARPLFFTSAKVCEAIDSYLSLRAATRQGVTNQRAAYRGLDPQSPLFLAADGAPFSFTKRVSPNGVASYSCESLTEIYRRLHHQAGIPNGNASAARRTFAVRLHRQGRSLKLIQELIGVSSLTAVKKMVESDPVRLATIVSGVI
ncbi:tyrosine-type recombinase/integrase [Pandoraea sp. NPDC087047]|uniref:tyrosine-type recombinase/integrase n=1 Tax=Pandoraea sp. NPDC087047 TaxID=3364390 RepID=UPI003820C3CB